MAYLHNRKLNYFVTSIILSCSNYDHDLSGVFMDSQTDINYIAFEQIVQVMAVIMFASHAYDKPRDSHGMWLLEELNLNQASQSLCSANKNSLRACLKTELVRPRLNFISNPLLSRTETRFPWFCLLFFSHLLSAMANSIISISNPGAISKKRVISHGLN